MEASIFSEIGKDGLRFLREDIHVGPEGMTTISGDHISSLLKINKESLAGIDDGVASDIHSYIEKGALIMPHPMSLGPCATLRRNFWQAPPN